MKSRLAKIFSLVPFCIMLFAPIAFVLGILNYLYCWIDSRVSEYIFGSIYLFGWIPAVISSVVSIVFSAFLLKEKKSENFMIRSCFTLVIAIVWGFFVCSA